MPPDSNATPKTSINATQRYQSAASHGLKRFYDGRGNKGAPGGVDQLRDPHKLAGQRPLEKASAADRAGQVLHSRWLKRRGRARSCR